MKFTDPKISLDKSWKFTPQVLILIILGIVAILGISIFVLQKKEAPLPEIPAPPKEETREELLERLTPKEPKPLTQEEKAESEELLKQLTPTQPKPMTEKEQKELEELLKQLTP